MKRSLIFSLALLFHSVTSHAAYVSCRYDATPCDAQGNHYFCEYYGWAYGNFCSPTDKSHGPLPRPVPTPAANPEDASAIGPETESNEANSCFSSCYERTPSYEMCHFYCARRPSVPVIPHHPPLGITSSNGTADETRSSELSCHPGTYPCYDAGRPFCAPLWLGCPDSDNTQ
jgi:hypothetical protein